MIEVTIAVAEFCSNLSKLTLNYSDILEMYADVVASSLELSENSDEIIDTAPPFKPIELSDSSDEEIIIPKKYSKKANSENESPKRASTRKSVIPWTSEEEEALIRGIKKYGLGMWSKIHDKYSDIFSVNGRTTTGLSRKWSRLKSQPEYQDLANNLPTKSKKSSKTVQGQNSISTYFPTNEDSKK
ncbi:Myb-like DNA-binding domain containing protein [Trichomonas vaginalis G3]|uniref:Myb-like DNA-binding domain containing protein n=1 Tax=Trichomonas vaginalis (strain ATCC PRA-98 / G3) TaxID=412133 RepID=A2DC28_TRIV3|nr:SANT/myb-like telomere repeat binding factor-like DNA-binding domain-containing protein [Trichomonas vaginalis G3]EAY22069.1 Myb-like DNA-binding domain containing protein [Trichomonas vaginalis G3]KAI5525302.1 SANT/myb-like telomere repeat binding factor-like DNA-binding domain-containing protein [Trichomonas vaginalis G3]|eukprot:XP_001583055.1 Myb-like DNA-binding domain containing protein [Trichomonas vaginalis G3]